MTTIIFVRADLFFSVALKLEIWYVVGRADTNVEDPDAVRRGRDDPVDCRSAELAVRGIGEDDNCRPATDCCSSLS